MPDASGFDLSSLGPERELMAGLSARAQALPGIDTASRDRAVAAATNQRDPSLAPLIQQRSQLADASQRAAQIESEGQQVLAQAKAKMQHADSQRDAIERKRLSDELAASERNAPELHPTQENISTIAGFASLLGVIGTAIGGRGKLSSMGALQSMTGLMKGWQEGKQAEWDRHLKEFDRQVQDFKSTVDMAYKKYQIGFQNLAADRESAKAQMDEALAELGSPLLKATRDKQGYEAAMKSLDGIVKDASKIYSESGAERRHRETILAERARSDRSMFRPAEITLKDGTKILGVFEEHTGRYSDAAGNLIDPNKIKSASSGAGGQRSQFQQLMIAQRMVTALRGAASATESIMNLPEGSRVGMLPFLGDRDGFLAYVKNNAGRKISSEESKEMDTLFTGVSRYLAAIEASGAATGMANLSKQLENLKPMSGDTVKSAALKLADIRRISTESVSALVDSGLLPEQMTTSAVAQIHRMETAIPFTTQDVVKTTTGTKKTLGQQSAESSGLSGAEQKRLEELEAKSRGAK